MLVDTNYLTLRRKIEKKILKIWGLIFGLQILVASVLCLCCACRLTFFYTLHYNLLWYIQEADLHVSTDGGSTWLHALV